MNDGFAAGRSTPPTPLPGERWFRRWTQHSANATAADDAQQSANAFADHTADESDALYDPSRPHLENIQDLAAFGTSPFLPWSTIWKPWCPRSASDITGSYVDNGKARLVSALEPHIRHLATASANGFDLDILRRDAVQALLGEIFVASDDGTWRTRPTFFAVEQDKLATCGGGI